jgi:CRP-like cAMP-binding protein
MTDRSAGVDTADDVRHAFALTALQRSPLFQGMERDRLPEIARSLRRAPHAKGHLIFSQGDKGDALYLVESGTIKISAQSADGREAIIGEVRPGETFGELVLVDAAPRSATATAVVDSVVLTMDRGSFNDLLESNIGFRRGVLLALASELRRATTYLGELHFLDLCGRIASRLAQMALAAEPNASGEVRLPGTRSQAELAAMVGGSRQRVNVHLGELVDGGMIRLDGREIVIVDREALERRGQW